MTNRAKQAEKRNKARSWASEEPEKKGFTPTAIQLPEGVEKIKFEAKTQTVTWDFMPYRCGRYNKRADEGELHYLVEFEQHMVPGISGVNDPYICAKSVFGKPCAVCTYLAKNRDKDLFAKMKAKYRILWLVNDKPGDKKNPLKVLETAMYNRGTGFGEQVKDAIMSIPEEESEEDCFPFSLKGGRSVQIKVKEEEFSGNAYGNPTRIDLIARKYDYPESVIASAPCLDECLICPDYDKLWALLTGEVTEPEEPKKETPKAAAPKAAAPKAAAPKSKPVDDDDLDDDEDDEEDDPPVRHSRR